MYCMNHYYNVKFNVLFFCKLHMIYKLQIFYFNLLMRYLLCYNVRTLTFFILYHRNNIIMNLNHKIEAIYIIEDMHFYVWICFYYYYYLFIFLQISWIWFLVHHLTILLFLFSRNSQEILPDNVRNFISIF